MDEWLSAWRDRIVPLRRNLGFDVVSAWVDRESNRFVWLLRRTTVGDWQSRDRDYYESDERRSMQPDPADCIARAERFFVEEVTTG